MKLLSHQLDASSLTKLGEEVCRLFIARDFRKLAATFGFAMAFGRDIAAFEADFDRCTNHGQEISLESVTVRHFKPNDNLSSLIECILLTNKEARILIELVVSQAGETHHLSLEDISPLT